MNRLFQSVTSRLSLRKPQAESLEILATLADKLPLTKTPDTAAALDVVRGLYPQVRDFERQFPSLCFALATGVGKTRLMGAFISYLYLMEKSRNFFVLAPNLTIYEKLIWDFSSRSPKYVFRGISEFTTHPPMLITGDNYETGLGVRGRDLLGNEQTAYINIFNISKINATDNKPGAMKNKTPKIKRLQEYIGESYFEYLAGLPDLVLLMDEAHRYRASAGAQAINELKPILGLELTATPKSIGARSEDFHNIVFHYPLAVALRDGFIKEPAVATRKDFRPHDYTPEQLETIKLEDGIHHHEHVKVELEIYARQNNVPVVKPFMLVVAQDTEHARQIRILLESQGFFDGRYKGKVAEIHSGQSGTEADENIQKLIAVENPSEATEIVVHVNKLKEGWDVTNLYTIVPLRASASEILTEQTLGRGLRLPYGKRTGVEAVDRLTVIAHDKFQAIVDAANNPDSIIRKTIEIGEGGDISPFTPQAVEVPSLAESLLTGRSITGVETQGEQRVPLFSREEQEVAAVTLEVAKRFERLDSVQKLAQPDIQEKIVQEVQAILRPAQGTLEGVSTPVDVAKVVATVTRNLVELTIDIPNIVLIPTSDVNFGFRDFTLQGLERINYQPHSNEILIQNLHTNTKSTLLNAEHLAREEQPEDYIVRCLIEREEIDYDTTADLLYKLAKQVVDRLRSYLPEDEQIENVAFNNQRAFGDFIFSQMKGHYWETPTDYKVVVSKGFSLLRPANFSLLAGEQARHFREIPENKQAVKRMLFTGFRKCCYSLQKFDSVDGELRLAILLEDDADVLRWMKPASHHFQIEYKRGIPYEPDFVVETNTEKLLIEPKMANDIQDEDVRLKAKAAEKWCQHATEHALHHGGKPWRYMLVPHSAITANSSLSGLKRQFLDNRLF